MGISPEAWSFALETMFWFAGFYLVHRLGVIDGKVRLMKYQWRLALSFAEYMRAEQEKGNMLDDEEGVAASSYMRALLYAPEMMEDVTRKQHPVLSRFVMGKPHKEDNGAND